jgi:caspase domain-containing protein
MGLEYRALLIGCSSFPEDPHNLHTLKGPPHDLRLLEDALTHPQVGLHSRTDVRSLLDCSRAEMLESIEGFFTDAGRDSQLLFYYSGHGRQDNRGNLYLAASDTKTDRLISTGVAAETINAMIANSAAGRTIVVLDCCHSGSFKGLDIPDALKGTGKFVLTSCRNKELSADADDADRPSAFTRHLVEALLSGAVDTDGDGFVSLNEIYNYVLPRLKAESRQIPQRHFDQVVGEVALGRAPVKGQRASPSGERPILNVSETSIELEGVAPGEVLPPEIVDVFNEGDGVLDWTVQCDDAWIRAEKENGYVKVTFSPRPGVNRGKIWVRDRGRGGSKTIRVKVEVAEGARPPKLEVSDARIDFGTLARGAKPSPRTIRLTNAGGGELRPRAAASAAWIEVRQYGEVVDVTPSTQALGEFAGELVIRSDGGEARVPVTATIEEGPVLDVERSVELSAASDAFELPVRNAGGGVLEWSFAPAEGRFFTARRGAGADGDVLLVSLKPGSAGRSHGTVRITSNGGDATIDVRLDAAAAPSADGAPPLPTSVPNAAGRWRAATGIIEITGTPPQYQFVGHNLLGIAVEQGTVFQQGAILTIQGFNLIGGPFTGQAQILGNQISGTLASAGGTVLLALVRE